MGNCCGKETDDPFAQPGRTLASAPPSNTNKTSAVPKHVGGPPRTLGSGNASSDQGTSAQEDARRKAAEAAEARANAGKPKGKLGSQLQDQKKQTRSDTLEAASKDERRMRDADAGAESRAYN